MSTDTTASMLDIFKSTASPRSMLASAKDKGILDITIIMEAINGNIPRSQPKCIQQELHRLTGTDIKIDLLKVSRLGKIIFTIQDGSTLDRLSAIQEFLQIPVKVYPLMESITTRFLLHDIDSSITYTELAEEIERNNIQVVECRRFYKKTEMGRIPTNTILVTIIGTKIPEFIKLWYQHIRLQLFIDKPRQCLRCHRYNHSTQSCKFDIKCRKCGENHETHLCQSDSLCCSNCKGSHQANDRNCGAYKKEQDLQRYKCEEHIIIMEARRRFNEIGIKRGKESFAAKVQKSHSDSICSDTIMQSEIFNFMETSFKKLELLIQSMAVQLTAKLESLVETITGSLDTAPKTVSQGPKRKKSDKALKLPSSGANITAMEEDGIQPGNGTRKGLLERLKENVVIGDGGFVFSLEKRGYVKAGPWTPEAAVEHPEAVRSLHREFLRAGSDVMQAFTFYASDDKLINRGNEAGKLHSGSDINEAACKIAREVADEGDALVAGGISQTPTYLSNKGKKEVQEEFRKQVQVFVKNKVDFLICEYFEHIEEMEWAIEVCKETSLPVAATMCIGSEGDLHNISAGQCAIRMAKAGADVVGLNCHFDPFKTLETIAIMKKALDTERLKPYLMTQPLAFHTPDAKKQGFIDLPEFPFALEPRVCTRWDMQRYAREAFELGVRYIGGCCGFESYHIRAVAEELAKERGKFPESSKKHEPWGEGLKMHTKPWVRARARKEYWRDINPSTGRPFSAAFTESDNWGITAGSEDLKQHPESTTNDELKKVFSRSATK